MYDDELIAYKRNVSRDLSPSPTLSALLSHVRGQIRGGYKQTHLILHQSYPFPAIILQGGSVMYSWPDRAFYPFDDVAINRFM